MFTYFLLFLNLLFVSFSFFSLFVKSFIIFLYLIILWLFFITCGLISFPSFDLLFHFGYSFFVSISIDSFTYMFIFLVLVVFTSWFVYLNYFSLSLFTVSTYFYLLHVSLFVLFVGNIALFVILLEFLSIPIFFIFITLRSNDWLVGLYFLFFYSSLTGLFLLLSLSHLLHFDFHWLMSFTNVKYVYLIFLSLLIKSATFPFHSWLPYVHGLCSTSGSVYLAGIFLKLGSYGLIRLYNIIVFFDFVVYFQFFFVLISLLGMFLACFASFVQMDFKKFIAFSSVFHMNFTVLVLFLGGCYASILVWLSHGFITSLLFFMFGYIYSIIGSKISFFFGNMVYSRLWYFLFTFLLVLDLGLPPFLSFYAEILSFYYVWYWSYYLFFFVIIVFLFSCYVTGNSILRFSVGFCSSVTFDLTLPFFYLYSSFIVLYLITSFTFVSFELINV